MGRIKLSHHAGELGIHGVATKVHQELKWLFRVQHEDFGIDAQLEVVTDEEPTGKIIAAQIKAG